MVEIYLESDHPTLLLSIPPGDIQRLSYRPLKWLRFVTFTICGARGDLLQSHNGLVVDYDIISINNVVGPYYYKPTELGVYVDYNALHDRITSSEQTQRRGDFREGVLQRDGQFCLITHSPAVDCDASHIIPRSKGDEYIHAVIQYRAPCYNLPHPEIDDIDDVENGVLLSKSLHWMFGRGAIAFLKTPNFALNPGDIPRVEDGPMPSNRITMQYLEPPQGFQIEQRDAVFTGPPQPRGENAPPAALLLDYMYGAAAYKRWGGGPEIRPEMDANFTEKYKSIPPLPPDPSNGEDSGSEPGDPTDGDYNPNGDYDPGFVFNSNRAASHSKSHYPTVSCFDPGEYQSNRPLGPQYSMLKAMDDVNTLTMYISGTTPKALEAKRWNKMEEKEKELKEQVDNRSKVLEWMNK